MENQPNRDVSTNLMVVRERMRAATMRAGREPSELRLLLATKTVDASRVLAAVGAGELLLGENKVLEGEGKASALRELDSTVRPNWHVIGHLQTNKIKNALRYADCIQSVDRTRLLEQLDKRLQFEGRSLDIMLQVNTSREDSKYGVPPEDALALARAASSFDTLRVTGLMTIGLLGASPEDARQSFRELREVRERILAEGIEGVEPYELSMGMSGDMEVAIEEGATLIRVGTAVFGARPYPDSYYWPS